jgi:hypothetical protein
MRYLTKNKILAKQFDETVLANDYIDSLSELKFPLTKDIEEAVINCGHYYQVNLSWFEDNFIYDNKTKSYRLISALT